MLIIPILYILVIWMLYFIEIKFGYNFNKYGVYPREFKGLRGVFFSHFIHSNTKHLFNNSIPLFVLLLSVFMFYKEVALKVLVYGALLTGFLTWIIARESYHIGASGVVYLLFSFVFFSGILKKHFRLVALSLIVIFLYGSMIWYVLPIKDGMSWEGHLSGFVIGLVLAFLYKNKGIKKTEPYFEETAFDLLFDENGNYAPPNSAEDLNVDVKSQLLTKRCES
ncbi:MAG: rhomboid family intramembrane serine protease [Polaribacter sp.]|uniref:rhomboid family intramembrane serine protease n=1 Tax=Wenyingzhuangia sp. TaxID=1964193 RepID=UPI00231F0E5E|nr:rhomboid family intramembrane serine protease [Polaribacter sp.]MDB4209762.1 rhomboid family intramembrane serine protease [Polaribacter sp.]MDB9848786.1 rhomboid family intramembrane serine protease [Polaribacter sp.]MDB9887021.1 rhomboid family intramembrane serine protease [Polaribacter sp.]MDC0086312.1 rhomboid family intramembrane serine protease [Polaribacter sp.]